MSTEVTFKLLGGPQPLIILPVFINEKGPFEFILDTGAGISLLSTDLARQLGVSTLESKEAMGAVGKVTISFCKVVSLAIGQERLEDLQVAITDEINRIAAAVGGRIDGVIGYNVLKNFRITVDYQNSIFRLARAEQEEVVSSGAEIRFKLANTTKSLILVSTLANGRGPFQFALDTGASTTVVSPELAENLGIKGLGSHEVTAGGGKIKVSTGIIDSLALGDNQLENLNVLIADFLNSLSQVVGEKMDGIVGYNYLKEFRVTIDYPKEILYLEN